MTPKKLKVAFHNFYENITENGYIFKENASVINGQDSLKPWVEFYKKSDELGWEMYTLDQVEDVNALDAVFFMDRPKEENLKCTEVIQSSNIFKILCLYECPMIKPNNWDLEYHQNFDCVLTWSDELVDGKFYLKSGFCCDVIQKNDFELLKANFENRKLACMINSCVMVPENVNIPQQLYGYRLNTIKWFESFHPGEFDLYGNNWNPQLFPSYVGRSENKFETFKNYKFAICFENAYGYKGYISEKILDCLISGVVPVYLGAQNISEWIPNNCFIDFSQFKSFDEFYVFLSNVTFEQHCEYLDNIAIYLKSRKSRLFSIQHFFSNLIDIINFNTNSDPKTFKNIEGRNLGLNKQTHFIYQYPKTLDLTLIPKETADRLFYDPLPFKEGEPTKLNYKSLVIFATCGKEIPLYDRALAFWRRFQLNHPQVDIYLFQDDKNLPFGKIIKETKGFYRFGIGNFDTEFFKEHTDHVSLKNNDGDWYPVENQRMALRTKILFQFLLDQRKDWSFMYNPTITSVISPNAILKLTQQLDPVNIYGGLAGMMQYPPYNNVGMVHGANLLLSRDLVAKYIDRVLIPHSDTSLPSDHMYGMLFQDVPALTLPLFSFETPRSIMEEGNKVYEIARKMIEFGHFHFRVKTKARFSDNTDYKREDVDSVIMEIVNQAFIDAEKESPQKFERVTTLCNAINEHIFKNGPRIYPLEDMEFKTWDDIVFPNK